MGILFSIVMLGLILAIVAFVGTEGLFSSGIMLFNVLFGALLSMNFWEPLAQWLQGMMPGGEYFWPAICMIGLWGIFTVLLRTITDRLAPEKVEFPKLVDQIGGPSVKPYQPPGVWEAIAMNVSNTRSYERGTGEELYRRSLYTFIKRMAPPASLEIFNAPNREYCVVQRERTNTPLQALVTLNDEQFVEAARHLAAHSLREGGESFAGRLSVLAKRLLGREFRPAEVEIIRNSHDKLAAFYAQHPDEAAQLLAVGESKPDAELDAPTLAAWTMLANELMNLDEVLNK